MPTFAGPRAHGSSLEDFLANLKNPRWANADHTAIWLDGVLNGHAAVFTASPNDPAAHGVQVWTDALAGKFGMIGEFVPLPPVEPDPPTIVSHRQFFQALAVTHMITEDEALAAMQGVIPAEMDQFINTLTPAEQFQARMIIKGAGTFDINHPLTKKFAEYQHMSQEGLAALWKVAADL